MYKNTIAWYNLIEVLNHNYSIHYVFTPIGLPYSPSSKPNQAMKDIHGALKRKPDPQTSPKIRFLPMLASLDVRFSSFQSIVHEICGLYVP
jgi:hypothetical protein